MPTDETDKVPVALSSTKYSLDEVTKDLSAFIHFLSENFDGENVDAMASFWMLIPKELDVRWEDELDDFKLEKEVFSRTIFVIAKTPPENERGTRKAELLNIFSKIIAEDQASQILHLMNKLDKKSREELLNRFAKHKKSLTN